jgi:hypothetical protein
MWKNKYSWIWFVYFYFFYFLKKECKFVYGCYESSAFGANADCKVFGSNEVACGDDLNKESSGSGENSLNILFIYFLV